MATLLSLYCEEEREQRMDGRERIIEEIIGRAVKNTHCAATSVSETHSTGVRCCDSL